MHQRLLPLLLVNFIESNPGPVKFAMAAIDSQRLTVPIGRRLAGPGRDGEAERGQTRQRRAPHYLVPYIRSPASPRPGMI